jgi:hypothetical protein
MILPSPYKYPGCRSKLFRVQQRRSRNPNKCRPVHAAIIEDEATGAAAYRPALPVAAPAVIEQSIVRVADLPFMQTAEAAAGALP